MQVGHCEVCGVQLSEFDTLGNANVTRCAKCSKSQGVTSSTPNAVSAGATGSAVDNPGRRSPVNGKSDLVDESLSGKSPPQLRAVSPGETSQTTPVAGCSTAFAGPVSASESSSETPKASTPAGSMGFYFCEKCGKRVTAADLARGQGRDKQQKGVHCAACSEGTMTVAFDAISQEEVWKEEQARRQGLRRSTSTRMSAAKPAGANRRGHGRPAAFRTQKSNGGAVWAVLAIVLLGGVGAYFAVGGGVDPAAPGASDGAPVVASGAAEASPAPGLSPVPVVQAPQLPAPDPQRPSAVPQPKPAETTQPAPRQASSAPVAQTQEPPSRDPQPSSSMQVAQAPEPPCPDPQGSSTSSDAQAPDTNGPLAIAGQENVTGSASEATPAGNVELVPEADAYTRGGRFAGRNYGTAPVLATKEDGWHNKMYVRKAYIRFDLSTLPASIASAKLRIYTTEDGGAAGKRGVKLVADDTWNETAINGHNAPAPTGSELATWQPVTGQFAELDLTAVVQQELVGDKKLSLFIYATSDTGGNGQADFASREAGNAKQRPTLIIGR